ncbi:SMC N terminal domain containing protein [Fusarium agapanthi]|uniref:SMC N terminal domain containing protein n=1 Tax=Fusarium agapanthi TaxID=1803897 RepID=A0A9P5B2D3_9HYPO|nr:SMC N terminal domain containing protein [Fusarium agapanthi]
MATLVETINILRFGIIPRLSIRDQLHLCQTSKDIHTATVSVLYRDITITHNVEAPDSPPLEPKELRRLERIRVARRRRLPWGVGFLFAILSRPALTSHVESLRFRIENHVHDEHFRDTGKLKPLTFHPVENENARQIILDGIDGLNFSETEKLNLAFKDRDFDLILSLIVAACTKVKSLVIDLGYFLYSYKWLLELFKNSLSPQNKSSNLQNVTHFEVANPRGWLGYQELTRGVHPLSLYLPNARTLSLESFASHRKGEDIALADTTPFWPLSPAPHATFLTTLHLDHCSSNTHNITAMLAQTPKLKTLFYACYLPPFESDFDRGLIDFSDHEWPLTYGRINNLREFLSLTDLEIPLTFLHGHTASEDWQPLADLLPPKLISLTIKDELMNEYPTFQDLYTEVAIRDMMRTFLSYGSRSSTLSPRHAYFYRYPASWDYENLSKGPVKEYHEDWKPVDYKYGSRWVLAER